MPCQYSLLMPTYAYVSNEYHYITSDSFSTGVASILPTTSHVSFIKTERHSTTAQRRKKKMAFPFFAKEAEVSINQGMPRGWEWAVVVPLVVRRSLGGGFI